jgi:hypothetical protein
MLQACGDGMLAPTTQLSAREALTVARIVKVNHAGEFGDSARMARDLSAAVMR